MVCVANGGERLGESPRPQREIGGFYFLKRPTNTFVWSAERQGKLKEEIQRVEYLTIYQRNMKWMMGKS